MEKKPLGVLLKELNDCVTCLAEITEVLLISYSSPSAKDTAEAPKVPTAVTNSEKNYTLEEVRAILTAKSKAGFREQIKELINKRGVDNLTKLKPSEYPALVLEAEGLVDG